MAAIKSPLFNISGKNCWKGTEECLEGITVDIVAREVELQLCGVVEKDNLVDHDHPTGH